MWNIVNDMYIKYACKIEVSNTNIYVYWHKYDNHLTLLMHQKEKHMASKLIL